jgi:heat shock protein HslJ
MVLVALLALGSTLTIVACAPAAASLAGHEYLSVAVTEAGAPRPLVAGTRVRLAFEAGSIGASAGCNSMSGAYRIDAGRLILDGLATTEMGCDPDRMAQDQWLAELLGSKPTVRLTGNELVLESGAVAMRLLDRTVADPDRPLVGPTWTVVSIIDGDAVSSVPDGVTATMVFADDGSVAVDTGCNRGRGTWRAVAGGIEFSQLALTKMACDGPAAATEQAVVGVLGAGTVAAEIKADMLTLQAGGHGLQLQAR